MTSAASQLLRRVVGWQLAFTLAMSGVLSLFAPHLLLLSGPIGFEASWKAALAVALGGASGMAYSTWLIGGRRFTLRYLALGSPLPDRLELRALHRDPTRVTWGWFVPVALALLVVTTLTRPTGMDLSTALTVFLLGTVIIAAAALPLLVLVRAAYLKAIELAPHDVMEEIVGSEESSGRLGRRMQLSRRLVAAVTTPVLFTALGSALIANAHVRRNDEKNREEAARALARAVLEPEPSSRSSGGLLSALEVARVLGFTATVHRGPLDYSVERVAGGVVELTTRLDGGSARVRFAGSTITVVSGDLVAIACLSVLLAGSLGMWLGRALIFDLRAVTRDVNALGTEAVMTRSRALRPSRFQIVTELGGAIDRLAARFRVFALAQERAIQARRTASRARGMFFASVSHDLKSPLNAILGFTELVRLREDISPNQVESLELIQRRGRELLAIIETILDAARVEAGQLTLNPSACLIQDLLRQAAQKAQDLTSRPEVRVLLDSGDAGSVLIDPDRMPATLATFIAHGIRSAVDRDVHVWVRRDSTDKVRLEVEVPTNTATPAQLEAMLDPARQPGAGQHRGLALGLRLARSVVELHGGSVTVLQGNAALLYVVRIPSAEGEPPASSGTALV